MYVKNCTFDEYLEGLDNFIVVAEEDMGTEIRYLCCSHMLTVGMESSSQISGQLGPPNSSRIHG